LAIMLEHNSAEAQEHMCWHNEQQQHEYIYKGSPLKEYTTNLIRHKANSHVLMNKYKGVQ